MTEIEILKYLVDRVNIDFSTGHIFWKPKLGCDSESIRWNKIHALKIAGGTGSDKIYRRIQTIINGKKFHVRCHRLIWFAANKSEMPEMIDHINGNGLDNRLSNLRPADKRLNSENQRKARSDNGCGVLGVRPHGNKYRAVIKSKGKRYHLGLFFTAEEAHEAYVQAKRQIHAGGTL